MAHHLGRLLVALLYVCAFSGGLLVAASLALLASLAGALLATLAASDARRLAGLAARVADSAAADLRLARAVAAYAVVKAAVRVALVVGPKIGALASRVRSLGADGRQHYYRVAQASFFCRAANLTAVALVHNKSFILISNKIPVVSLILWLQTYNRKGINEKDRNSKGLNRNQR
ncbi:unnamed protein product [Miscanthus lutarioriparius]|uniref:Uncharacterized protein n=1 Tax=Miscanthus lutarioriparius TaxID=422564 RepID=A0A811RUV1_9POAL|nr:unnamed protein product [Miscanthus lutarioriparius]